MLDGRYLAVGVVLAFALVHLDAQRVQNYRGQVNHTKQGICNLEVPTIDLLSPEDRRGVIPRGNGSREGFSKIEVCCSGYVKTPHTQLGCVPHCDGCENGNCTAPNVCVCRRGYVMNQEKNCIPTCPVGCLNGVCTTRGECSCNAGYELSRDGKYCTPRCSGGCGIGGVCTGPEACTCSRGFSLDRNTNKCGYHCEGGCGEGTCIGPNQCSCKPGFKVIGNSCRPDCPKGCHNGECTAPNRCSCKPGWTLDVQTGSVCTPHCSKTCLNGDCVGPEICACKKGYIEAPESVNGNKCVAHCPGGCPNGVCSAPNFCICDPGYVKESKGSNVCVRRYKRSAVHFDLIPEEVIAGQ